MAGPKKSKTVIEESSPYKNFVDESAALLKSKEPPPPKNAKPDYPHRLKVHIATCKDAGVFAKFVKRTLRSDEKSFVFTEKSNVKPTNWKYVEKRKNPTKRSTSHLDRIETKLWTDMVEFINDPVPPYITFNLTFRTEKQYVAFTRRLKEPLSLETSSVWYPVKEPQKLANLRWSSAWKDKNPRYPLYIVSKGRADSRQTSRTLERMGVPYYIAVEPQDYEEYSCVIDEEKILKLPFSNHGDGPGRARNWCWDHAMSIGAKRFWVMDDNIEAFYRLHENRRIRVKDGGIFRAAEDFVDRFSNVPVAGFQYRFFCEPNAALPPFVLNTRIYSCQLNETARTEYRQRARWNEDTIQSLDVLKNGDCTIQFNAFLQGKGGTQKLKGGNTAEFYAKDGTYNKSAILAALHPDVAEVVWRYGRWHHHVDYSPFKDNKLKLVKRKKNTQTYSMVLEEVD
jgi:hypothetical protein